MDAYFGQQQGVTTQQQQRPSRSADQTTLIALFNQYQGGVLYEETMDFHFIDGSEYADPERPGMITFEGVEKLCNDLKVDPSDVVMLVLSFYLQSPKMCEITREGWVQGWSQLGYWHFDCLFRCTWYSLMVIPIGVIPSRKCVIFYRN